MTDGIRELIQRRIDEITAEVARLRSALSALSRESSATPGRASARPGAGARGRSRADTEGTAPTRASGGTAARTSPGATRDAVLAALAGGEPMTAGQVAQRSGLARGTVSTTLSRLARAGTVEKAQRGYRLPTGG